MIERYFRDVEGKIVLQLYGMCGRSYKTDTVNYL